MTQVNPKLPDLGAFSFSTPDHEDADQSYSVQTPYGFHLDLDFLKVVEEIEQGSRRGQRSSLRGRRLRSPAVGRTSAWTSTESLTSPPPPPPRHRLGSAPCESLSLLLSPVGGSVAPLSAGAKVPPPPPQRNPRVERTLLETSLRLQQEQSQQNGAGHKQTVQSVNSYSALSQGLSQSVSPSTPQAIPSTWTKPSPHTSGRSTPAGGSSSSVPPSQLQTVREQMASALKQLKEMEERVKGVPALEREVCMLRAERETLLLQLQQKSVALEEKERTAVEERERMNIALEERNTALQEKERTVLQILTKEMSTQTSEEIAPSNQAESDVSNKSEKTTINSNKETMETNSLAIGEDKPMHLAVFYYSQDFRDVGVSAEVTVNEQSTTTELCLMKTQETQVETETENKDVWVMESMLGTSSEAQREIDTLQDTIKFQQESISALEDRLIEAGKELENFREKLEKNLSKVMCEKGVLAAPEMQNVETSTVENVEVKDVGVSCCVEVKDANVGEKTEVIEREMQTENYKQSTVEVSCQCEERNEQEILERESENEDQKKEDEELEEKSSTPKTGLLKSIMKRNDGNSSENRSTGKKSLQFVGILNGGYESTSSEEEDEDGSSSEHSDDSDDDDDDDNDDGQSSEDEAVLDVETSEEERNINLDESDTDEEQLRAEEENLEVKEKFELNSKMREACLILKNYLKDDGENDLQGKEVLSSSHTVQLEWFRVSSAKSSPPSRVSDFLMAFSEISSALLKHVVNMTDGNGNTALHYSVSHSNFRVVELLLDTGLCSVDKQNKAGYTAIMLAALSTVKEEEDMKVVEKLFSQGNVNAKASQAGQTALMLAVSHGRLEMVRALLLCGADVNIQDDEGSTALMCASEHGRSEIVRLLLDTPGCDIALVDNDGSNALSIALEACHNDTAVLLYAHMNYNKTTQPASGSPKAQRSPSSTHKVWPGSD